MYTAGTLHWYTEYSVYCAIVNNNRIRGSTQDRGHGEINIVLVCSERREKERQVRLPV